MEKISIFGAGSWGTALGYVLAQNKQDLLIWTHRAEQAEEINQHTNNKYLKNARLPENLVATADLAKAVAHADVFVLAVPTKAIREVCTSIRETLDRKVLFVHVSKGIEPDSLKRISEMIREEIPEQWIEDVVVLSGPSHAEEVVQEQPTTVTAACENTASAERVQDMFMNQYFRVYTNTDVIGVELGGALKNIIALAVGITSGLGYGDNAKAALMTRGLAEIARLGVKMGATPLTFSGLTGVGDLIVTCTSVHSRNWRAGNMLGKGKTIDEVLEEMGMVVEGIRTTKAAHQLAQKFDVPMPITDALFSVLFDGVSTAEAVNQLMGRNKKNEMEDLINLL
ncbi:NAD(P)H-dependent glycerol-3-phosphate dehydrogenase [Planococcus sp. N028]|uniref:Glycerol-3-phosphate dehydrogenase [NAD(P)+] n=1 Tax=Planococcus shixiaomingii TaxID=3058393 RepID=A0ABT8MZS1_9BACL|nr:MULTISPECIES: NAD(P)H-dependent glycerol-3-phosphate dehydrogenase [unclassified Planococcus (in: firmicutes)]MDN7241119.1 NAD(P)H-dependent glycerol-3-phosphate dehydrogenase [Planococcus sp. N028]WKA53371.1 NAD(P)H-dependent glycerol-3-phosphate dehydrogenase [Planococcus sp. N022]